MNKEKVQQRERLFAIAALAALVLSGCSDDDAQFVNAPRQVSVNARNVAVGANGASRGASTILAGTPAEADGASRTQIGTTSDGNLHIEWVSGDKIGVFGSGSAEQAELAPSLSSGQTAEQTLFTGTVSGDITAAYYPYQGAATATNVPVTIGDQTYIGVASIADTDIKVGDIATMGSDGSSYDIDFYPLVSMICIQVSAGSCEIANTETLRNIKIANAEGASNGAWAGTFTFNPTDGKDAALTVTEAQDNISIGLGSGVGQTQTTEIYCAMAPGLKQGDLIDVTLTTDQWDVTMTFTVQQDMVAGALYTMPIDMAVAEANKDKYNYRINPVDKSEELLGSGALQSLTFALADNADLCTQVVKVKVNYNSSTTVTDASDYTLDITEGDDGGTINLCIPYLYNFTIVPRFTLGSADYTLRTSRGVITSGQTAVDFSEPVTLTVRDTEGRERDYVVTITNSGLPVVVLNTNGDAGTKEYPWAHTTVAEKTSEWPTANTFALYDHSKPSNNIETMDCGFRLRGNSSMNMPQKPFAIKLSSKQKVLGMASHKRWCLLAGWQDNSRIRNQVAFEVARVIQEHFAGSSLGTGLAWNPSGKNVEVVLDGAHIGNYLLCEQIKIGSKRLNIADCYEDRLADGLDCGFEDCGYLLEFDTNYDETYKFYTSSRRLPCMSKDDVLTDDIWNQLQAYINLVEECIVTGDYEGSRDYLDWASVIDWWFVHELTMNDEYKHPKSVYMYKDGAGLLCAGPVWDFDYQTFPDISAINSNQVLNNNGRNSYKYTYSSLMCKENSSGVYMWYPLLLQSSEFVAMLKERWESVYPSLSAVTSVIAELGELNALSWQYNHAQWWVSPTDTRTIMGWFIDCAGDELLDDYPTIISTLISSYTSRLEGLNTAINNL
ncbi:MAG: CotH kinase family protein [Bacteroidales bacterium]|nr:CotH kinase family protein [Bacteroidales bacterium]